MCSLLLESVRDTLGQVRDVVQVDVVAAINFKQLGALGGVERVELIHLDAAAEGAEQTREDCSAIGARVVVNGHGVAVEAASQACDRSLLDKMHEKSVQ